MVNPRITDLHTEDKDKSNQMQFLNHFLHCPSRLLDKERVMEVKVVTRATTNVVSELVMGGGKGVGTGGVKGGRGGCSGDGKGGGRVGG